MDLSGKLIIKAQLGDDIRRIPIHNEDITYDELVLMMQRVYRGKLNSSDEVTIKYKDEDGDLITIFDSADLTYAIQCSRILRLTLFVNGQPLPLESDDVKHIRKELQSIRNRVNHLLDHLELSPSASVDECASDAASSVDGKATIVQRPVLPRSPISGKEFDPLSVHVPPATVDENAQNKVLSSFGLMANDGLQGLRTGTPDSIGSTGSSNQPRPLPPQQQQQQQQMHQQQQPHRHITPQQQGQDATTYQHGQPIPVSFSEPHPIQTGYSQQAVVSGYGQVPAGYSQAHVPSGASPYPGQQPPTSFSSQDQAALYAQQQQRYGPQGAGQPQQMPGQPQQPQAQQPAQQQQQYQAANQMPGAPAAPGATNPYSRGGPSYGQYPRPHGQYPRAPQPTNYQ
jgi:protein TFG